MPHAHCLQRDARQHLPILRRADSRREPLRVGHVAAQPLLQPRHALLADREPQFQCPETASQRQSPIAQILHLRIGRTAQIAWIRRHHAHQVFGVAYVVERTIEGHAQPLVQIEHQRIGAFDALPHPAAFGQHHGGPRHCRVHVKPDAVRRGNGRNLIDRVERRSGSRPRRSHDRAGPHPRRLVARDSRFQNFRPHGEIAVVFHHAQILAPESGQQRRLLHRAMTLRRRVDDLRLLLGLQSAAAQTIAGASFARAQ